MSFYQQQEIDFIKRTKIIIQQYENIHVEKTEEKFEKTLFINCLLGLLIIPQQYLFDKLPNTRINTNWGILESEIRFIKESNKSINDITRHLRNSISHYNFEILSNDSDEIESIKFIDKFDKNKKSFEAIISIENLKIFTDKLTDFLITEINKQK